MYKNNLDKNIAFNKINILYVIAIVIGIKKLLSNNSIVMGNLNLDFYVIMAISIILGILIFYYIGVFIGVVKIKNERQFLLFDTLGYIATIYILINSLLN